MIQNSKRLLVDIRLVVGVGILATCWGASARAANDLHAGWTFQSFTPADVTDNSTGPSVLAELGNQTSTATLTGFHTSALSDWTSPVGNGSSESYSVTNWTAGDYYQVLVDTTGVMDLGLQFDQVSSTTGPRDFMLQYSTDGSSFTTFGSYVVQPITTPSWSSSGPVSPAGLDTFVFDLRSITSLNNVSSVYLRMTASNPIVAAQPGSTAAAGGTNRIDNISLFSDFDPAQSPIQQPFAAPVLPVAGDIVMGLSSGRPKVTMDLVRGTAVANGGAAPAPLSPWQETNFIQFPRFDNLNGVKHNVAGNLIGVDVGTGSTGGRIYNFATQGTAPLGAGQLIGNSTGTGGAGLTLTRFSGPSISPNNTKIAVAGNDTGKVIVFDYTAGDTMGSGASLSGARQTASAPLVTGSSQGTAWLDDNTVLTLSVIGELYEVDATSMATTLKTTLVTGSETSRGTSLAYNPDVSPYLYAMYGGFTSPNTNNQLYILDPANSYNLVKQVSLNVSASTARDIALDKDGNLFISQNGSKLDFLFDVKTNPAGLTDDSSVDWYTGAVYASSNGFDIGFAPPAGVPGDYNDDGKVDAADYVLWRKGGPLANEVATIGSTTPEDYTEWRARFGNPPGAGAGLGGNAAVPEPGAVLLMLLGVAAVGGRRR